MNNTNEYSTLVELPRLYLEKLILTVYVMVSTFLFLFRLSEKKVIASGTLKLTEVFLFSELDLENLSSVLSPYDFCTGNSFLGAHRDHISKLFIFKYYVTK